jgi:hypothetical protein
MYDTCTSKIPIQRGNAIPSFASPLPALAVKPPPRVGGARCQQQREPPIDGYRTVPVGGIVLGEGVETECEQEYRDELFHVDREV